MAKHAPGRFTRPATGKLKTVTASLSEALAALDSGDDQQAEDAVPVLVAIGAPAHAALLPRRQDANPDRRWWAFRALAAFPQDQSDWLRPGLHDPDPAVRQVAALGLRQHPQPRHASALAAALADEDALVADLAMQALIAIGQPAAPVLLQVLEQGSRRARLRAVRALAAIAAPEAIPALMHILEQDSALMQYWADQGLDNLGLKMIYFKPD